MILGCQQLSLSKAPNPQILSQGPGGAGDSFMRRTLRLPVCSWDIPVLPVTLKGRKWSRKRRTCVNFQFKMSVLDQSRTVWSNLRLKSGIQPCHQHQRYRHFPAVVIHHSASNWHSWGVLPHCKPPLAHWVTVLDMDYRLYTLADACSGKQGSIGEVWGICDRKGGLAQPMETRTCLQLMGAVNKATLS